MGSPVTPQIVVEFRQISLALQDHYITAALKAQPFLHDLNSALITEQYAAALWRDEGSPAVPSTEIPYATRADLEILQRQLVVGRIDNAEATRRANRLKLL